MKKNKSPAPRQPRRTELQLSHDRAVLAKIALKNPGATSTELAELFYRQTEKRLAPRTIRDDLKVIEEVWRASMLDDYNTIKATELAKLNILEQEAWDAWNQSKDDFVKKVIERARRPPSNSGQAGDIIARIVASLAEQNAYVNEEVIEAIVHDALRQAIEESVNDGEDGDTFISKVIDTTEVRVGDVRYLRAIHEIQQERRKILGVYAPELHQYDVRTIQMKGYIGWSPNAWDDKKQMPIIEGESTIISPKELPEPIEYDD